MKSSKHIVIKTGRRKTEVRFKKIMNSLTESEKIESDSFILMSSFLSLIEIAREKKRITRKELATLIGTSHEHLTQIFRGDKPLNFISLAKIQRALDIQFSVSIKSKKRLEKKG